MESTDLLIDAFDRIRETVHAVVDGLSPELLAHRIDGSANSIGWIVWHLTRVQDDHIAEVAGAEQAWLDAGWERRFGLKLPARSTGYGHTSAEVAAVRADAPALVGYHDDVHARTVAYVRGLGATDFDRIVDDRWDPPVSLGVRIVSVIDDDAQHAGQAMFVRGLIT